VVGLLLLLLLLCRDLLVSEDFKRFSDSNPQLEISTAVKGAKHPQLRVQYAHGGTASLCVRNKSASGVLESLGYLRNRWGFKSRTWTETKRHVTTRPSIQGVWTPSFVPPTLSEKAQANATAVHYFAHKTNYDYTQQLYPSSIEAAKQIAAEKAAIAAAPAPAKVVVERRGRGGIGGPRRVRAGGAPAPRKPAKK
jgi:hypothetical protein